MAPECAVCGARVGRNRACNYCGRPYCGEHTLPERHDCPALDDAGPGTPLGPGPYLDPESGTVVRPGEAGPEGIERIENTTAPARDGADGHGDPGPTDGDVDDPDDPGPGGDDSRDAGPDGADTGDAGPADGDTDGSGATVGADAGGDGERDRGVVPPSLSGLDLDRAYTADEVAAHAGIGTGEAADRLVRLAEDGWVERVERDGRTAWRLAG